MAFVLGLFAYVCGCIVVIEDLTSGKQKLLRYHMEDISSLAAQNDGEVIASASVAGPSSSKSQICIWEIKTGLCRKVYAYLRVPVFILEPLSYICIYIYIVVCYLRQKAYECAFTPIYGCLTDLELL